jgi:hypothetical protein
MFMPMPPPHQEKMQRLHFLCLKDYLMYVWFWAKLTSEKLMMWRSLPNFTFSMRCGLLANCSDSPQVLLLEENACALKMTRQPQVPYHQSPGMRREGGERASVRYSLRTLWYRQWLLRLPQKVLLV